MKRGDPGYLDKVWMVRWRRRTGEEGTLEGRWAHFAAKCIAERKTVIPGRVIEYWAEKDATLTETTK